MREWWLTWGLLVRTCGAIYLGHVTYGHLRAITTFVPAMLLATMTTVFTLTVWRLTADTLGKVISERTGR